MSSRQSDIDAAVRRVIASRHVLRIYRDIAIRWAASGSTEGINAHKLAQLILKIRQAYYFVLLLKA